MDLDGLKKYIILKWNPFVILAWAYKRMEKDNRKVEKDGHSEAQEIKCFKKNVDNRVASSLCS